VWRTNWFVAKLGGCFKELVGSGLKARTVGVWKEKRESRGRGSGVRRKDQVSFWAPARMLDCGALDVGRPRRCGCEKDPLESGV